MPNPLRIALGDLAYLNPDNAQNLYVPLNIGYLASTLKSKFGRDIDVQLFKDPKALLAYTREAPTQIVGLSHYYWNAALNDAVLARLGPDPMVVAGGPSIDSDPRAQAGFMSRHPRLNIAIANEGEDGMVAIVEAKLGGSNEPVRLPGGLSTDLAAVPSPYLDGTLDAFLGGMYQPLLQTSRLCPYTCSFCVSGKNRGKLRAFPMEQVSEELRYIARAYQGQPNRLIYICDENFGILDRDKDIARDIVKVRDEIGYPRRVFYYNDKRFTQTSRDLQEILGSACYHGVTLSLQSENPETLKAIKRRNLTDEQIIDALAWAKGLNLKTSTELIFGLPCETLESFLGLLDKCARLGFEAIQCYNLILFDGIEMNRVEYRQEHQVATRRRPIHAHAMDLEGIAVREYEEVAVSSASFSEADFRAIRSLNVLFHTIFVLNVARDVTAAIVDSGASLTGALLACLDPGRVMPDAEADVGRQAFLAALMDAISNELAEEDVELPKLQPVFAGRLAGEGWLPAALAAFA